MDVDALFHQGLITLATVAGPMLLALLGVGLLTGILQAATQINDPAVSFLPRLLAAGAICALFGGWMVTRLAHFLAHGLALGR
jgi:flagellar biosynthetic protein FliQ